MWDHIQVVYAANKHCYVDEKVQTFTDRTFRMEISARAFTSAHDHLTITDFTLSLRAPIPWDCECSVPGIVDRTSERCMVRHVERPC